MKQHQWDRHRCSAKQRPDRRRSEKTGGWRKKGRRLIRRNLDRSSSAFSFCSVIKKWINGKETHASANATAVNKLRKSVLFRGCTTGSRVRSWRYTHCLLVSLHPSPFSFYVLWALFIAPALKITLLHSLWKLSHQPSPSAEYVGCFK